MSEQPFSDEVAVRIALAARVVPGISTRDLIEGLQESLGDEINETTLSKITVTNLKTALGPTLKLAGKENGESSDIPLAAIKEAAQILWGETVEIEASLPPIEPYEDGEMPESIRVAVASNTGEELDGHFGSCLRYLVYQLSADKLKLIDIRSAHKAELSDDKSMFRVNLINDCHVVYIISVGGPAAAKIIRSGLYPIKNLQGGPAREILAELQKAIATSPPPWVAKAFGVSAGDRVKNYKAAAS